VIILANWIFGVGCEIEDVLRCVVVAVHTVDCHNKTIQGKNSGKRFRILWIFMFTVDLQRSQEGGHDTTSIRLFLMSSETSHIGFCLFARDLSYISK